MEKHTSYLYLSYAQLFTLHNPSIPIRNHPSSTAGTYWPAPAAVCVQMNGTGESPPNSQGFLSCSDSSWVSLVLFQVPPFIISSDRLEGWHRKTNSFSYCYASCVPANVISADMFVNTAEIIHAHKSSLVSKWCSARLTQETNSKTLPVRPQILLMALLWCFPQLTTCLDGSKIICPLSDNSLILRPLSPLHHLKKHISHFTDEKIETVKGI